MKELIEKKLGDCLFELKLRCRSSNLTEIQRMYGVVLGLNIALMEVMRSEKPGSYMTGYKHCDEVNYLIAKNFGNKMKLKDYKAFAFKS